MTNGRYNGVIKIIGVVVMLVVLIVGVGVAYGELKTKVNNNEKDIAEMQDELRTIGEGVAELLRRTDE